MIVFPDYPDFKPNLTPRDIFLLGSFGGTYWRPIFSTITQQYYSSIHKQYPFLKDIPDELMTIKYTEYNTNVNKFKVKVGTTLHYWECKQWITKHHPYGWVHWYCDFYSGKRGPDDERQIQRWIRTAGPKSRFRKRLINMIREEQNNTSNNKINNIANSSKNGKKRQSISNYYYVSPKIHQTLQHWGYRLTDQDIQ